MLYTPQLLQLCIMTNTKKKKKKHTETLELEREASSSYKIPPVSYADKA